MTESERSRSFLRHLSTPKTYIKNDFKSDRIFRRLLFGFRNNFPKKLCKDNDDTNVVETKAGKIRGATEKASINGKTVLKYLNIPYAEAPVGELRFEKPVPKKPWRGIKESIDNNISCIQPVFLPKINMTEDCLILNVWSPHPKPTNAAVVVFIHGGAFLAGSSHEANYHGANFVALGDVILVNVNYRLSALGFLTAPEVGIKGNLALFDQRLAMKWVKENIKEFGGNPNAITLFGGSAGSACVSAHTLSEESWPYFDRVIYSSGNMLMYWTLSTKAREKNESENFLKEVNCYNSSNVLKCLKNNVTTEQLKEVFAEKRDPFTPAVDGDFFKDHPQMLFRRGKVKQCPIIFGTMGSEMYFQTSSILAKTRNITRINRIFNSSIREAFFRHPHYFDVAKRLYSPKCTPSFVESLKPLVDMLSDWAFTCPMKYEAHQRVLMFPATKVFVFRYTYPSPEPHAYPVGTYGFANHGQDYWSIFGLPFKLNFPMEDKILSLRLISYFANFAKTGHPNRGKPELPEEFENVNLPNWPLHSPNGEEYLEMQSLNRMIVKTKLREKYCDFWSTPMYALYRSAYF
ncbi:acetylcholinesterase-like isoform X2 [Xenia sp. Carnegie-2017]|uniref:acetylcholinesterase-like isoform X2 n=1 Tax=Xenia sp. Carnegie-2017 TaxID=2897299 RepID=UPI001F04C56A|nr:acetylcholinesterase-like isoform X2 [Xenia sp. Carnegie-2017]